MAYEPWQIQTLMRYGLVNADGSPVLVKFKSDGGDKLSPKVDPEVINRLFMADSTPNHKWTALRPHGHAWVFYQAGGGDAGVKGSERSLDYIKSRYIKNYGEEAWEPYETQFKAHLFSADEEVMQSMRGSFGFARHWPGARGGGAQDGIYEHIVVTLTTFLQQFRKLVEMNKNVPEGGVLPVEPDAIESWEKMKEINGKVANWVAAGVVRKDVRLAKHKQEDWIYDDDYVRAIAPLTYAAAVKYGWEGWDISDPDKFASVSQGELAGNPWDRFVKQGGAVVFIQFHVPVPRWTTQSKGREGADFTSYRLENLLLNIDPEMLRTSHWDSWTVTDEEGHSMPIATLKEMIQHEPERGKTNAPAAMPAVNQGYQQKPHPLYQEKSTYPIMHGRNVHPAEPDVAGIHANEVLKHLDHCLETVRAWAIKFTKGGKEHKLAQVVPAPQGKIGRGRPA